MLGTYCINRSFLYVTKTDDRRWNTDTTWFQRRHTIGWQTSLEAGTRHYNSCTDINKTFILDPTNISELLIYNHNNVCLRKQAFSTVSADVLLLKMICLHLNATNNISTGWGSEIFWNDELMCCLFLKTGKLWTGWVLFSVVQVNLNNSSFNWMNVLN